MTEPEDYKDSILSPEDREKMARAIKIQVETLVNVKLRFASTNDKLMCVRLHSKNTFGIAALRQLAQANDQNFDSQHFGDIQRHVFVFYRTKEDMPKDKDKSQG